MPIVILSEHKNVYFDALENADMADCQSFIDFMLARCLEQSSSLMKVFVPRFPLAQSRVWQRSMICT